MQALDRSLIPFGEGGLFMNRIRIAILLMAVTLFSVSLLSARVEYAKKEGKPCNYCHTKGSERNDIGKCYEKTKNLADCKTPDSKPIKEPTPPTPKTMPPAPKPVETPKGARARVGTFQRKEVLVSFYGSAIWVRELESLRTELEEAKSQNDSKKVVDIELRGNTLQELAHRQLAGEAALTNILAHLESTLPTVAKEARVQIIVEQPIFRDNSIELVDVTPLLVKQFPPAAKAGK